MVIAEGGPAPPADPLRILFLSWNYPPARGGIEEMVSHLHRGLLARGHHVHLVTGCSMEAPCEPHVERAHRPGLAWFELAAVRHGVQWARRHHAEVILCGSVAAAPAAWAVARLLGAPYVVPAYGSELALKGWWRREAVGWWFRRAARVLPISRASAQRLRRHRVLEANCTVIPPGVDVERFERLAAALPPDERWPGRDILLSVGRLVRRKGVLELVEQVMPTLIRWRPSVLLVVAGDDARQSLVHAGEGMRARIESAVRRLGLTDHVVLLGAVSDEELVALYRRADLFVLPALDLPYDVEGFGIVFLEAALASVPAVATRVGGIPDAVEDGRTGLLVEPGDWPGFAMRVLELLADRVRRAELGRAAATRARQQFAWPAIVARYERVLAEVAGRGASFGAR
ncbi:MAG: glycosyltransferase family 4 protein [Kiritimatiellae bacterium]|nr:glycosyltransferase family 4 protein [Kiritimatiellia bacterium]